MTRRNSIRGMIRDTVLLIVAGGLGSSAVLAQGTPPSVEPGHLDLLLKLFQHLGPAACLAVLAWFKHQQCMTLGQQLLAQAEAHTKALVGEKDLRIQDGVEFTQRINNLQDSSRLEFSRLYTETAAERTRFMDAHLALTQQKGKKA